MQISMFADNTVMHFLFSTTVVKHRTFGEKYLNLVCPHNQVLIKGTPFLHGYTLKIVPFSVALVFRAAEVYIALSSCNMNLFPNDLYWALF
jgi:hypothetical protein